MNRLVLELKRCVDCDGMGWWWSYAAHTHQVCETCEGAGPVIASDQDPIKKQEASE